MLDASRIADQLRRAFSGDARHGSPWSELLSEVAADQAFARPLPSAHTIWELVLHIAAWVNAACVAAQGGVMPNLVGTDGDWPPIRDNSPAVSGLTSSWGIRACSSATRCATCILNQTAPHRFAMVCVRDQIRLQPLYSRMVLRSWRWGLQATIPFGSECLKSL